jgi:hypothetical protein
MCCAASTPLETVLMRQRARIVPLTVITRTSFPDHSTLSTLEFNDNIFAEREEFLRSQVESDARALGIYRKQFEVGQISALPLLQVQARYVGSQIVLTRVRNERLSQRINLHLALGGSF